MEKEQKREELRLARQARRNEVLRKKRAELRKIREEKRAISGEPKPKISRIVSGFANPILEKIALGDFVGVKMSEVLGNKTTYSRIMCAVWKIRKGDYPQVASLDRQTLRNLVIALIFSPKNFGQMELEGLTFTASADKIFVNGIELGRAIVDGSTITPISEGLLYDPPSIEAENLKKMCFIKVTPLEYAARLEKLGIKKNE